MNKAARYEFSVLLEHRRGLPWDQRVDGLRWDAFNAAGIERDRELREMARQAIASKARYDQTGERSTPEHIMKLAREAGSHTD